MSSTGAIVVRAAPVAEPAVTRGEASIDAEGRVRKRPTQSVEIVCPEGTHVSVGTKTADVELVGRFGQVAVSTHTGRVEVEHATSVDVRSNTGNIRIGRCEGRCAIVGNTGTIVIAAAREAMVTSKTGDVSIHEVVEAQVRSATGTVRMHTVGDGVVDVRTMSGGVEVAVPGEHPPVRRLRTMSGRVEDDSPAGFSPGGTLAISTMSGNIVVACR